MSDDPKDPRRQPSSSPLEAEGREGVEQVGVWLRDTLGRREGGFYHLGHSTVRPEEWTGPEALLDEGHREDFRLVAEGLGAQSGREKGGQVVLVGDDLDEGRGRCYLAFQVGRLLAESGRKVLLVDGEFEQEGCGDWLGEPGREGLLDVARYGASLRSASQPLRVRGMDLLGVGSFRPEERQPLAEDELQAAFRQLRAAYDFILVTAPARTADGTYNPLFLHADGVLMGLSLRGARRDRFEELAEYLLGQGVPIYGVMAFAGSQPPAAEAAPAAPTRSTSPYAELRRRREHESSRVFRRMALVVAVILVGFVGAWAFLQWRARPSGRPEAPPRVSQRVAPPTSQPPVAPAAEESGESASTASADSVEQEAAPAAVEPAVEPAVEEESGADEESAEVEEMPEPPPVEPADQAESAPSRQGGLPAELLRFPSDGWALHLWSFPDSNLAVDSEARLKAEGFSPRVVAAEIEGKGTWYRVLVGSYPTRREALDARDLLSSRPDVDYVGVVKVGR